MICNCDGEEKEKEGDESLIGVNDRIDDDHDEHYKGDNDDG